MPTRINLFSVPLTPQKKGLSIGQLHLCVQHWIAALCDADPSLRYLQHGVLQHELFPDGNTFKLRISLELSPQTQLQFTEQTASSNRELQSEGLRILEKLREMQTCIDNEAARLKRDVDGRTRLRPSPLSQLMLQFENKDIKIETQGGSIDLSSPPAPAPVVSEARGLYRIRANVGNAYEDHLRLTNFCYTQQEQRSSLRAGRKLQLPDTPERKKFSLLGHVASLASLELEAEVCCLVNPLNQRITGYQLCRILNETTLVEVAREIMGLDF